MANFLEMITRQNPKEVNRPGATTAPGLSTTSGTKSTGGMLGMLTQPNAKARGYTPTGRSSSIPLSTEPKNRGPVETIKGWFDDDESTPGFFETIKGLGTRPKEDTTRRLYTNTETGETEWIGFTPEKQREYDALLKELEEAQKYLGYDTTLDGTGATAEVERIIGELNRRRSDAGLPAMDFTFGERAGNVVGSFWHTSIKNPWYQARGMMWEPGAAQAIADQYIDIMARLRANPEDTILRNQALELAATLRNDYEIDPDTIPITSNYLGAIQPLAKEKGKKPGDEYVPNMPGAGSAELPEEDRLLVQEYWQYSEWAELVKDEYLKGEYERAASERASTLESRGIDPETGEYRAKAEAPEADTGAKNSLASEAELRKQLEKELEYAAQWAVDDPELAAQHEANARRIEAQLGGDSIGLSGKDKTVGKREPYVAESPLIEEDRRKADELYAKSDAAYETGAAQYNEAVYGLSDLGKLGVDLAQGAMGHGVDALANRLLPGVGGKLSMGARVYFMEAAEARRNGDDYDTQVAKGMTAALIEVGTEMIGGPFGKIYGKSGLSRITAKAMKNPAVKLILDSAGEGAEEGFAAVANLVIAHLAGWDDGSGTIWEDLGEQADEILYEMLVASIIGGFGSTTEQIADGFKLDAANKALVEYIEANIPGGVKTVVRQGVDSAKGTTANKLGLKNQGKLDAGKTLKPGQVRAQYDANAELVAFEEETTRIADDAEARLTELGETGDIPAVAAIIAKATTGQKITEDERRILNSSKYGVTVKSESDRALRRRGGLKKTPESSDADIYAAVVEQKLAAEEAAQREADGIPLAQQTAQTPAQTDGQTVTQTTEEQITEQGQTPARPQNVGDGGGAVTVGVKSTGGGIRVSPKVAGLMTAGQNKDAFDVAATRAYRAGLFGTDIGRVETGAHLTEEQRRAAYEMGERERKAKTAKNKALAGQGRKPNGKGGVTGFGITLKEVRDFLGDKGNKVYRTLDKLSRALGVNIVLYDSEKVGGQLGKADGAFYPDGENADTIFLDIKAGFDSGISKGEMARRFSEWVILRTFGHELGHFTEKWAAEDYEKLRAYVFDYLASKGVDVDALIDKAMADGKLDEEAASREVMANGLADILPQSDFIERLYNQDRTLWEKIVDELKKFIDELKTQFAQMRSGDKTRDFMEDGIHYAEDLLKMWTDVAEKAVKNYQAAETMKSEGEGQVQSAIKNVPGTNKKYVKADRDVLYGNDPEAWGEQITAYINKEIRQGRDVSLVAEDGVTLVLTSETAGKAAYRNYVVVNGVERLSTEEEYNLKLRVEAHIDEVARVSVDKASGKNNAPDYKGIHGTLASEGWRYRTVYYQDFDGRYYKITLSVAVGSKGNAVYNVGDIKERSFPNITGSSGKNPALKNGETSSESSISQSAEESNSEFTQYSLKDSAKADKVNQSMTMQRAADMVQRAFNLADIRDWFDGEYKTGLEWLKGEGAESVAVVIENDYNMQLKYLNNIPEYLSEEIYLEDILEAYAAGTLTGKETKPKTRRLDTKQSTGYADSRFYAPKQYSAEESKALYETASQKVTKKNREEVNKARAALLFLAHDNDVSSLLGISKAEFNKKLRTWSAYSKTAMDISQRINSGVPVENRWTGIQNCSIINKQTVSDADILEMVKEIKGKSEEYQRQYIARTMLALDTHIDWSRLSFAFKPGRLSGNARGMYADEIITIGGNGYANTVAHEMGHALDDIWGRDILGSRQHITESSRSPESISDPDIRQFFVNFRAFLDSITDAADIRSDYTQRNTEVFARFVAKFVEFADQTAGNTFYQESSFYSDRFTSSHYIEFARLLQEKAMLDGKRVQQAEGDVEGQVQYARKKGDNFRTGQNAMGVYTQTELIDLENMDSEYWTGNRSRAKYKMDETEFKQVYREIEKLSRNLPEYGTAEDVVPVSGEFTVFDGKGREFWYTVEVDGYMHGEIHQKINVAKFEKNVNKNKGRFESGHTGEFVIRSIRAYKDNLERSNENKRRVIGDARGTIGDGGVGSGTPERQQTGTARRGGTAFEGDAESLTQYSRKGDSRSDEAYLAAVNSGDMVTAQRMVDEAARAAGYTIKAYHGTPVKGFTVFDPAKIGSTSDDGLFGHGFYFSTSKITADGYATANGQTMPVFLKINKAWWGAGHNIEEVATELGMDGRALSTTKTGRATIVRPAGDKPRQFTAHLIEKGYDSVIVQHGKNNYEIVMFDNSAIKAADPVTYDDSGNVIPLSERFNTEEPDIRFSRKEPRMSDLEVLEKAANELPRDSMSEEEQKALDEFKRRLDIVRKLQAQREELGRLYKEQVFTKGGDRAEGEKTRNRMGILDQKIKAAENALLGMKNRDTIKAVLKKARKVAEAEQKARDDARLKAFRANRDESDKRRKYKQRVEDAVREMMDWLTKPDSKDARKRVPLDLQKALMDLLKSIDFSSASLLRGKGPTQADLALWKKMQAVQDAVKANMEAVGAESGMADMRPEFQAAYEALMKKVLALTETGEGYVLNRMSGEELKELAGLLKELKHYVVTANSFVNNAAFSHVGDAGKSSISHMKGLGKGKSRGIISRFFSWMNMRPAYVFPRFGKGGESIYEEFREGQSKQARLAKFVQNFAEATFTPEQAKKWANTYETFEIDGKKINVPITHLMSLYCLNKRPQAITHLLGGGIRVAKSKGVAEADTDSVIGGENIRAMVEALNRHPEAKAVADKLQQFMSTECAKWGNEVDMARFGVPKFVEKNYFPINTDGRYLAATADEAPAPASLYALLNAPFTKAVNEKADQRLILYNIFDVFANHAASMVQYRAYALPTLDALKWFNYKDENGMSVREAMAQAFGSGDETGVGSGQKSYAEDFVINLIRSYNGANGKGDIYESLGQKLMGNFNRAQVAFNLRTIIQQPTSIFRASLVLPYKSIVKGLGMSAVQLKSLAEEMEKYSGIALWKSMGFYDVNISRGLAETFKQEGDWRQKLTETGMKGAELADRYTWAAMWYAAKDSVSRAGKTDEQYFAEVTKVFEEAVYKTQVVDSVLTKAETQRATGFFAKSVMSFMSEPIAALSMLTDAVFKYDLDSRRYGRSGAWQKNRGYMGKVFTAYAVASVLNAVAQAIIDAWRDDDEYEDWWEKYTTALKGNVKDELNPLRKVPLFNDLFSTLVDGYEPTSDWAGWTSYITKGYEALKDATDGDGKGYTLWGGIYNLMRGASGALGAPLANISREGVDLWNHVVVPFRPNWKLKTYDPGVAAEIKYAYLDGYIDAEEAQKLLVEEGATKAEEGEKAANEAYWMVQGWDGEGRYDDLKEAILAGDRRAFEQQIERLTSHGVFESYIYSEARDIIKEQYLEGEMSFTEVKRALISYGDRDEEYAEDQAWRWRFEKETGYEWGDTSYSEGIQEALAKGDISRQQAIEWYAKGCTSTHGSREEAEKYVRVLEWRSTVDGAEDFTVSGLEKWDKYGHHTTDAGLGAEDFVWAWQHYNEAQAQYDSQGNQLKEKGDVFFESLYEYYRKGVISFKEFEALVHSFYSDSYYRKYKFW